MMDLMRACWMLRRSFSLWCRDCELPSTTDSMANDERDASSIYCIWLRWDSKANVN